jgi:hypothetical protein
MTNNRIYSTWVSLELVCIPPIMVIDVIVIGKMMMNYQCGTPISLGYAGKMMGNFGSGIFLESDEGTQIQENPS